MTIASKQKGIHISFIEANIMRFTKQSTAAILGAFFLVGLFATTIDTSAQTLERQVIGNGATMIFDGQGNFVFGGTVGQTFTGVSGYEPGSVDLYHGFWYFQQTSSTPEDPTIGETPSLWNSPNPFTSSTTIHFNIPNRSDVRIRIYDMDGKLVRSLVVDRLYTAGEHTATWDATNDLGEQVATGYYYYTLDAQPSEQGGRTVRYQQKMLLMQ